ncbi:MAG: hypothetical protein AMJ46_10180 [Latescibacteria bacterium DG_63]|nr:MAG: hypothetical protein AMJ46_10180 [Latescibacteria bacterium DG_63]
MKRRLAATGIVLVALVFFACPALAQPLADYGDAPDPSFPSLFASSGPRHIDTTDCYVGWMSTAEWDALVPDLDVDDGAPLIFASMTPAGTWFGWVFVPLTIDPAASPLPGRFLNVLLDCNSSGDWCDPPSPNEWIVRNYILPPVHTPGMTIWYCIGGFSWVTWYDDWHWLRVTLSDRAIAPNVFPCGWDGSEGPDFAVGETEDWVLSWYYDPWDPNGGGTPGPLPPHRPGNPPLPQPVPECKKTATVWQEPPPTHKGHGGPFNICVKNTSANHEIHIKSGPSVTHQKGDPNDIDIDPLASTYLQPGQIVCTPASWAFQNPPANATWCDFDVEIEPQGQIVIVCNVGDYTHPTDCDQTTGGSFVETGQAPGMTGLGIVLLIIALGLVSVYFVIRRSRVAARS